MYHYTYRITNIIHNKHYFGSRTSKVIPKDDLGIIYFSSSSDTEFMQDQINNPCNYKYKIINTFDSRDKATSLEIKLQKKYSVNVNDSFYNKGIQSTTGFDTTGMTQIINSKGDIEQISSSEYNPDNQKHMNSGYINTIEKGRVLKEVYYRENLTYIYNNMIDVIVGDKVIKITRDEYNLGKYKTPRHNKIVIKYIETGKNKVIDKATFDPKIHVAVNKGTVHAIDLNTFNKVHITIEEFNDNVRLVGLNASILTIFDINDDILFMNVAKLEDIIKSKNLPSGIIGCSSSNNRYKHNTKNKSKQRSKYLSQFDGIYYSIERIRTFTPQVLKDKLLKII